MQIAKVVPKVRTRGEGIFDYSIPPQILPDIKIGLLVLVPFHGRKVEGIIVDIKKSSAILNLKPIISVIDIIPVVDDIHIKLARWMSNYYITDFSKTLFENIVPPARRILKKSLSDTPTPILAAYTRKIGTAGKKYLIVANFKSRLDFYLRVIQKTLARSQQVIILVPDLSLIPFFTQLIKNKIAILHAGLTHTQRWQEWDKIRRGDIDVVIGSNSALFAPIRNLGLIIIDQEENETYKSGQAPRYHAVRVAEELTRLTAARLVLGSLTPRVETYFEAIKNKYLFKKTSMIRPDITMVDMNFERSILSEPLRNQIVKILEKNQRALLVLNRKNTLGFTTSKLEKMVKEKFSKAKIIRIEKDIKISLDAHWDIAIATSFALKLKLPKIGVVALVDADQDLNFPDFRSAEKTFGALYKFLRLGERGLIQTHLPENEVLKSLAKLNYEMFYLDEIANRQKSNFPPSTSLVRLLYRNTDEKNCYDEAKKIYKKLSAIHCPLSTILGPSPLFISRQRGYYYQQIIIKSKPELPQEIKDILKTLPKGWIIDVDPYDLS